MKRDIFNLIVEVITARFDITNEELFSKSKRRDLVDARHMLYLICKERHMSVRYIQEYMNASGYETAHSPIIYGIKSAETKSNEDPDYKYVLDKVVSSMLQKMN